MTQFASPGLIKIIDANGNPLGSTGNPSNVSIIGPGNATAATVTSDAQDLGGLQGVVVLARGAVWNNTAASWEKIRTPGADINGFHTGQATAIGVTSMWTPTAGKRIRLLALKVGITGNASMAAAGVQVISLRDGTTTVFTNFLNVWLPAAAGGVAPSSTYETPWVVLGPNGYQSQAINNAIGLQLGTALATGNAYAAFMGVEE